MGLPLNPQKEICIWPHNPTTGWDDQGWERTYGNNLLATSKTQKYPMCQHCIFRVGYGSLISVFIKVSLYLCLRTIDYSVCGIGTCIKNVLPKVVAWLSEIQSSDVRTVICKVTKMGEQGLTALLKTSMQKNPRAAPFSITNIVKELHPLATCLTS